MRVSRPITMVAGLVALSCGGGGGDDGGTTGPPPPGGNTQTLGSISTSVASLNLGAGTAANIEVIAYDVNNQVIANPGQPTFTSSRPSVAEVDATGSVLAIEAGTAQITVRLTMGSVTRTADVAVSVTGALPSDAAVVASSGDYVFTPPIVALRQGGSVTWTFGALEHTVTFSAAAGAPASINSGYAGSVSRVFNTPGNFSYVCTIHAGMTGKVIVR